MALAGTDWEFKYTPAKGMSLTVTYSDLLLVFLTSQESRANTHSQSTPTLNALQEPTQWSLPGHSNSTLSLRLQVTAATAT